MTNSTKPLPPRADTPSSVAPRSSPTNTASGSSKSEPKSAATSSGLRSVRWWIIAAAAFLAIEAAIILWLRSKGNGPEPPVSNEIVLGTFDFNRSNARENRAYRGQFDLAIRVADDLSTADRRHVADIRPELQRAAEEALWRLRPVDFADRRLTRLKSRIQEQLNDAVGFEAIAEVVVSNFTIDARDAKNPIVHSDDAALNSRSKE